MATSILTLDAIGLACHTDKASCGHNYLSTYDKWLAPLREHPITLVEIGVQDGFSLHMWDSFFTSPGTRIVGMEIYPGPIVLPVSERTSMLVGDATKAEDIGQLVESLNRHPIHIIIDDGSHFWQDQQNTLNLLWPHLAPRGQYWIEDLHTSYLPEYRRAAPLSTVDALKQEVDGVMRGGEVSDIHFWKSLCLLRKS